MDDLKPRQRRTIPVLLSTRSIQDASQMSGVPIRTIMRWLNEPIFKAALISAEDQVIDSTVRRLIDMSTQATDLLSSFMEDDDKNDGVRLRAAQTVLDNLLKMRELRTLDDRLAELEKKVFGKEQE